MLCGILNTSSIVIISEVLIGNLYQVLKGSDESPLIFRVAKREWDLVIEINPVIHNLHFQNSLV